MDIHGKCRGCVYHTKPGSPFIDSYTNDQMPQDERGPEISFKIHIPPSKGLLNDED